MGTASGVILILLTLGIGGYCWYKQSHPQDQKQAVTDGNEKSWKERLSFWKKTPGDEINDDPDTGNEKDEFLDEETGVGGAGGKNINTGPQKGWMDSMADKLMEVQNNIPSANKMKMMMFKNSMSSRV